MQKVRPRLRPDAGHAPFPSPCPSPPQRAPATVLPQWGVFAFAFASASCGTLAARAHAAHARAGSPAVQANVERWGPAPHHGFTVRCPALRRIRIFLGEEVPVEPLIDAVRATFLADGTQPYVFAKKQKKKDTVVRIRRAVEEDTTNAPVFVAMRDVFAKEAERLAQGEDGQAGQDDDDDDDDSGEGNEGGKQPGADGDSADEAAGSTIMWVPMKGKAVKKTKLPKRLVRRLQAKAKAATATAADTAAAFSLAQVGGAPANESDSPDDSAAVQAEEDGTNDANDMNVTEPFRWKAHLLGLFGVVGGGFVCRRTVPAPRPALLAQHLSLFALQPSRCAPLLPLPRTPLHTRSRARARAHTHTHTHYPPGFPRAPPTLPRTPAHSVPHSARP